tara:strand:+ start:3367 stop:4275 length:909 start_codon:yes stop_codon:yes gene_type:complete
MGAGEYALTINDENDCSRMFDFTISQPDSLYFNEFGYGPAHCRIAEYQPGNGLVFGLAAGGISPHEYKWTNLTIEATSLNTNWGGLNPGDYTLTTADENGCVYERTITVGSLNPIADFEMTSPEFTPDYEGTAPINVHFENLSINYSNPNAPAGEPTFFWNIDTLYAEWFLTHNVLDEYDTTYTAKGETYIVEVCLVALNKDSCRDTTCKIITIYEPSLLSPINVCTPNGDGINEVFTFDYKASSISEFSAVVVNRWGAVMHEMDNITDAWDGNDKNGKPYNDGTYFYGYSGITDNGTGLKG